MTYSIFRGCSSTLAAKKRAHTAISCIVCSRQTSKHIFSSSSKDKYTHRSMKFLERMEDIEPVHVNNGRVDAQLRSVAEKIMQDKYT